MPKYNKTLDGQGNPVYTEVLGGEEVDLPGGHEENLLIHSSGVELFYGEDQSAPTSTNSARTDIPGTVGVFVVPEGGRPVYAEFGAYMRTAISNGLGAIFLVIDDVDVPNSSMSHVSSSANAGTYIFRNKRLGVLTPGEHTCKLVLTGFSSTNTTVAKGDAGASTTLRIFTA